MSQSVPACDLSPGDVIMLSDYPCDVLDIEHSRTGMTWIRWSICPEDIMGVSRTTLFNVLGRLDDN